MDERAPELAGLDEPPELVHRRGHRRQVLLADHAARGDRLPDDEREREREDEDDRVREPGRPLPVVVCGRVSG
jgi:hypothetical protein